MPNKVLFCLSFLICACPVFSQENSGFLSADINPATLDFNSLCKPGVPFSSRAKGLEISYQYINGTTLQKDNHTYSFIPNLNSTTKRIQQFKFKIKIPLLLTDKWKVIAGYEYNPESFEFSNIGNYETNAFTSLDGRLLKSNSFSISLTRPLNHKFYTAFQIKTSFNGDYDSFISTDSRYSAFSFAGILGMKNNPNTEYGFGLAMSHSVRKTQIVPFLVYNKTFNKHWGLETVLPAKVMGRYNYDKNTLLLFGLEYSSQNYSVDVFDPVSDQLTPNYFNQSNLKAQISLERKLVPWVWTNFKFGYQRTFDSEFDASMVNGRSFDIESGNPLFFKVGLFISPPDKYY